MKIGVIGYGRTERAYARALEATGQEVVAIAAPSSPLRAEARCEHPGARVSSSPGLVAGDPSLDAVFIGGRQEGRSALARMALQSGKHVLVDARPCATLREARHLFWLARSRERLLLVGHPSLHAPAVARLRELLASEDAGRVRLVTLRRSVRAPLTGWAHCVWDLLAHDVALCNALVGAPPDHQSATADRCFEGDPSEVAHVTLHYPGGTPAQISFTTAESGEPPRLSVLTDHHRIRLGPTEWGATALRCASRDGSTQPVSEVYPRGAALRRLCAHFVARAERFVPRSPQREAEMNAIRVLERVRRALDRGTALDLHALHPGALDAPSLLA